MAPPVNEPGHPPDVTALIVPMETDATDTQKGTRETSVNNVRRTTTGMTVVMVVVSHKYQIFY